MATPLVVGDDSHNYQTYRKLRVLTITFIFVIILADNNLSILGKERDQCGLNKGMTVNQCRGSKETFGQFVSAGIGDPYIDAGQYIMRKPDQQRSASTLSKSKAWTNSGANKKVRKSEFVYMEQGPPARPKPESLPRFKTHVKSEPFTNGNNIGYMEDPYEHK